MDVLRGMLCSEWEEITINSRRISPVNYYLLKLQHQQLPSMEGPTPWRH